jgi:hypothetical protein
LQADTAAIADRTVPSSRARALSAVARGASAFGRRFETFERLQTSLATLSAQEGARRMDAAYRAAFSAAQQPNAIRKLTGNDVSVLYRAARTGWGYAVDPRYVRDMTLDLNELQRRGLASQAQFEDMYEALVASRKFADARTLARRHPSRFMPPVPEFRDASGGGKTGPTELVLSRNGRELVRRDVDLGQGGRIVVVASPLCHFCVLAVQALERDPALRDAFAGHAVWLVSPDGTSFAAIREWNHAHPREAMVLAYNVREWPMLAEWAEPTFYFFKRHKVVAELDGWLPGRNKEVRTALEHVGLL